MNSKEENADKLNGLEIDFMKKILVILKMIVTGLPSLDEYQHHSIGTKILEKGISDPISLCGYQKQGLALNFFRPRRL